MVNRKAPSLPRGLPRPPPTSTKYAVYVTDKHWRRIADSISNPEQFMIIEGYPHLDADEATIVVFASKVTTKSVEGDQ
jgi:hypothetical protein